MSWRDLIGNSNVTSLWLGGRTLHAQGMVLTIKGRLPPKEGMHEFTLQGKNATWVKESEQSTYDFLSRYRKITGYLADGRFIPDNVRIQGNDPTHLVNLTENVWLLEEGLDRFARITVCRYDDTRLIYLQQEFPLGPEDEVRLAYIQGKDSVKHVAGVTPALNLAFQYETFLKVEAEKIRLEKERLEREEAARIERENRRKEAAKHLASGEGRREMAEVDFEAAARAALAVGGAKLLSWRNSNAREAVVQFEFRNRGFECVCDKKTLRITDAGICLTSHTTGEKGDTYFTLESLPGVIQEAIQTGKLVVFRHVYGYDNHYENERDDETDEW